MQSQTELRRDLRAKRRALSPAEQRAHAGNLARLLGKHPAFLHARRVAAYWAADGELNPFPLFRLAHARHKHCHLPVLRPHPTRKLWFLDYRFDEPLTKNVYGIPEPALRSGRIRLPWALDLLLMPLVGFDANCNRLGMGGGFYDRTLAYLRLRRCWRRPLLIGIAHECQRVERMETNPWDVPLDLVVTEERIYRRATGEE
jgi:5-formyltetrahydrofolate cyclo-ligase